MTPEIQSVLRLQGLDQRVAELEKEIAALPKHIAEIEKALDSHNRRLERDKAALAANQRERKAREDDIKVQEQKVSKLRDQMLQAKTNEQYRAFQHEIEFCQTEVRKSEDRILDLMGEAEPLEQNVKAAEVSLSQERKQVDQEKSEARDRTAVDQKALSEVQTEKASVAAGIPAPTLKSYERMRKKYNGTAIADATSGRCSACQISLRPQYFQELRNSDQIHYCESCGRILYYNPPVSLEHELHTTPGV